jgi:integrase
MKLTVARTEGLKLPAGKTDHIVFDDDIPGFGLRLRTGGGRWIFQYMIGQRQRRMTFGNFPTLDAAKARKQAEMLHAAVKLGRDPVAEENESRARSGDTFEACMRLYLGRRRGDPKLRPASYGEIERHLVRNLKTLHGLSIDKVDRRAIARELGRLTKDGPIQANRTRASLVKFLSWCAGEGFIDANPATFTNKNPEVARERVLANAELRKLWQALPEGDYGDIVRLLMLTGQREREIGDLRWEEIDLDRSTITLPPARTKNRQWHVVPLSAPALAILKARQRNPERNLVFGIGQGQRGFSGWSRAKTRLDVAVAIEPWTIHDIRRTVSIGINDIGILPHVVEAVLNHVSNSKGGVAGVYNKSTYEAEKTTALAQWAEHLTAVVEGRATNVTPLRRA